MTKFTIWPIMAFMLSGVCLSFGSAKNAEPTASELITKRLESSVQNINNPQLSHPSERLKLDVTINDQKKESPYWPLSPGTAAFLTLLGSSGVGLFVFFGRNKHEKEMRKIQSDAVLREKVYLEAAESFAWAISNFSKLFSAKPDEYFQAMNEPHLTKSIYKMNLVAKDDTLEKIDSFNRTFASEMLKLSTAGAGIQLLDQKAARISKQIDDNLAYQQRMISKWHEVPEMHRSDILRLDFEESFNKLKLEFEVLFKDRGDIWQLVSAKRLALTMDGIKSLSKISVELNEVCFAIRHEMELPINMESYRSRAADSFSLVERELKKFQLDLERTYKEVEEGNPLALKMESE